MSVSPIDIMSTLPSRADAEKSFVINAMTKAIKDGDVSINILWPLSRSTKDALRAKGYTIHELSATGNIVIYSDEIASVVICWDDGVKCTICEFIRQYDTTSEN